MYTWPEFTMVTGVSTGALTAPFAKLKVKGYPWKKGPPGFIPGS